MRISVICTPYLTKKYEIVGADGTYEGREMRTGLGWRSLRESDLLEDLGIDGRIYNNQIDLKDVGRVWTGLVWLGIGTRAGCCEHGNELSDSIKCGEFLDLLRNC
jgi:hypothetical protein